MKACPVCGCLFDPSVSYGGTRARGVPRRYCSVLCKYRVRARSSFPSSYLTCRGCGRTFHAGHWNRRYCSGECREHSRYLRRKVRLRHTA